MVSTIQLRYYIILVGAQPLVGEISVQVGLFFFLTPPPNWAIWILPFGVCYNYLFQSPLLYLERKTRIMSSVGMLSEL